MKKLTVYIVALFLLFTLSFSITLKVYANIADNNFRWHGNTAYFRNYNTDWSGGINNAASKYNNTDLNTSYVTTGGSYRIT